MNQASPGLSGAIRVLYFLGLASLLITFVITAVTKIYTGPSDQQVTSTIRSLLIDQEKQDYDRNLGVIFSLIGCGLIIAGVAGLRPRLNVVRAGVLLGGLSLLFTGIAYASSGSAAWLAAVWALLGLVTLGLVAGYVENGGDIFDRLAASRWSNPAPPEVTPPAA